MNFLETAVLGVVNLAFITLLIASAVIYPRTVLRMRRGGTARVSTDNIGPGELVLALGFVGWFLLFTVGEVLMQGQVASEASTTIPVEAIWFNLIITCGLLGLLLGVLKARGHQLIQLFGLNRVSFRQAVTGSVIWILLAYPLVMLSLGLVVFLIGEPPAPQPVLEFFMQADGLEKKYLLGFTAVVAAPVFEEIVFRGFLYPVFKRFTGALVGAMLSALLFSMVHVYLPAVLAFFVLALCLTVVYERTGSIWLPIGMHMIFNGITLVLTLVAPEALTGS